MLVDGVAISLGNEFGWRRFEAVDATRASAESADRWCHCFLGASNSVAPDLLNIRTGSHQ